MPLIKTRARIIGIAATTLKTDSNVVVTVQETSSISPWVALGNPKSAAGAYVDSKSAYILAAFFTELGEALKDIEEGREL